MRQLLRGWRNPLGLALALLHAVAVLAAIGTKVPENMKWCCAPLGAGESLIAGRIFHFSYETVPVKLLMFADLPALAVADLALMPLTILAAAPGLGTMVMSYVGGFGWLVFGSFQWWAAGTLVYLRSRQKDVIPD